MCFSLQLIKRGGEIPFFFFYSIITHLMYKTLHGLYKDNEFFPDSGEPFFCISYKKINREANNKTGFFNFRYKNNYWIIYQYLLDEELKVGS